MKFFVIPLEHLQSFDANTEEEFKRAKAVAFSLAMTRVREEGKRSAVLLVHEDDEFYVAISEHEGKVIPLICSFDDLKNQQSN